MTYSHPFPPYVELKCFGREKKKAKNEELIRENKHTVERNKLVKINTHQLILQK